MPVSRTRVREVLVLPVGLTWDRCFLQLERDTGIPGGWMGVGSACAAGICHPQE